MGRLTVPQKTELTEQKTKGPRPTFGKHRVRTQNALVERGLSEYIDEDGNALGRRDGYKAHGCRITDAGRKALFTPKAAPR